MTELKLLFRKTVTKLSKGGFFHIFGASTINKIIGFASTWVIVRLVSKADYGVYTYAYNIYHFVLLLNGFGIASAVLQMGSETDDLKEKERYYKFGLWFGTLADLFLAFVMVLIGLFIPLPIEGSGILLAWMFGLPLLTLIPELQYMYLRINARNKEYSSITILNTFAVFVLSCILAYLLKTPGLIIAGYLSHIITIVVARNRYKIPVAIHKIKLFGEELKTVVSIALISMLNNGLSRLMYLLDIFVLGLVIPDSTVVAAYKIATNIPTALQFIPAAIIVYIYPHFARNKDNGEWLISHYKRLIVPFGLFNVAVSAFMFVFAKYIIKILFGVQYLDAVTPFRILSVAYFFSATLRSLSGNLLVTQRKLKFNLFISVFSSAFNTVLNVFMIRAWASNGAAVATLLTGLLSGLISTTYLLRIFKNKQ